eukprot:7002984-Lingulodinium_polyedra.AAC.1
MVKETFCKRCGTRSRRGRVLARLTWLKEGYVEEQWERDWQPDEAGMEEVIPPTPGPFVREDVEEAGMEVPTTPGPAGAEEAAVAEQAASAAAEQAA